MAAASISPRGSLSTLAMSYEWPQRSHKQLRGSARWEKAEVLAVAPQEIDESRVVDGIVGSIDLDPCVIRAVGVSRLLDRGRIAGQPDETRMERRHVALQVLRRIALRVDRDEDRLHSLTGRPQPVHRQSHLLQVSRTDVRAIGEAEIDQHEFA